jgi:hypothetical protein
MMPSTSPSVLRQHRHVNMISRIQRTHGLLVQSIQA